MTARARIALVGTVALLASAAGYAALAAPDERPVVIGVGGTTEQQVLAALTVEALDRVGVATRVVEESGGTTDLRVLALAGDLDVYWDYTGAAWALGLRQQSPPAATGESFERVRQADAEQGLVWLGPTAANATLALFVREGDLPAAPEDRDLTWLSRELAGEDRRLCADPDFVDRDEGLPALAAAYSIDLAQLETVRVDEEEAIVQVADGRCFAGLGTATSGLARTEGLVPVADELVVFPAFVVAPVVREEALAAELQVEQALAPVVSLLGTEALAALNARVEEGAEPTDVAAEALGSAPPAAAPAVG